MNQNPNDALRQRRFSRTESCPIPRRILKKTPSFEEDVFVSTELEPTAADHETTLYILPACFVVAAVISCTLSTIISAAISIKNHAEDTTAILLEYNYCQVALGAVLFFEVLMCATSESVQVTKLLIGPFITKIIGVIVYSCLANGYLPLLHAVNGRVLNINHCLLWATSSPLVIYLYGKISHRSSTVQAQLMSASALGSLLLIVSFLASYHSGQSSMLFLLVASGIWAVFLNSIFKILVSAVRDAHATPPKFLLDVNVLFILSWASVPTIGLCGAFGLCTYRSEEISHGIMDFSFKICLSCLLLRKTLSAPEALEPRSPIKKRASFSDTLRSSEPEPTDANGPQDSNLPGSPIQRTARAGDLRKRLSISGPADSHDPGSSRDGGRDGGRDDIVPVLRLQSLSTAGGSGFGRSPSAGDEEDGGGGGGFAVGPMSGSRKNLADFIGQKLPDEMPHYSQISGGKLEVLSVDDDPINQVIT